MIDRTPLWKPSKARIAAANLTVMVMSLCFITAAPADST